jgi:hypothetical protein
MIDISSAMISKKMYLLRLDFSIFPVLGRGQPKKCGLNRRRALGKMKTLFHVISGTPQKQNNDVSFN